VSKKGSRKEGKQGKRGKRGKGGNGERGEREGGREEGRKGGGRKKESGSIGVLAHLDDGLAGDEDVGDGRTEAVLRGLEQAISAARGQRGEGILSASPVLSSASPVLSSAVQHCPAISGGETPHNSM
jgi:hypothetical protein